MTSSTNATTKTPTASTNPQAIRLGTHDVFPIGLGCMGMSGMYGASDDDESVATIHAAMERGVDGRDALRLVGGAVHAGHAHAAQRDLSRRHGRTVRLDLVSNE